MSEEHFKVNEDGTIEKEDIQMVEDSNTSTSSTSEKIDFNSSWSAYTKQESYPFKNNVHLRYNRFNPEKNYLLGDITESDGSDEMTYMHWIHNFLNEYIDNKNEILLTSVNFEESINFSTNLIEYENKFKYNNDLRKELNKAVSASCMLYTPSQYEIDYLNIPTFKHFYFLDNIAKQCLTQNRNENNCDFTYNQFKENELNWLIEKYRELKKCNYINITNGIADIASGINTLNKCYWYKVELNTKNPVFCLLYLNI